MKLITWTQGVALAAFLLPGKTSPPVQSIREYTGVVVAWQVEMDGRIAIRLRHTPADGVDGPTWFVTPAPQAPARDLELVVMNVLLDHLSTSEPWPLTVRAKAERSLKGEEIDGALPIVALARR